MAYFFADPAIARNVLGRRDGSTGYALDWWITSNRFILATTINDPCCQPDLCKLNYALGLLMWCGPDLL